MRFLIVDDSSTMRRIIINTPNKLGHQDVQEAGNGKEGTVAFAGKTSGLVVFYSTLEGAQAITASMVGIEPASVNGELSDAIGELTNMIAGSFRARMASVLGETWAISVPTVTVGSDFYTKYVSDVQHDHVLKLANSAYCAPMQEITTVNDAIVRMGTGPVRNVYKQRHPEIGARLMRQWQLPEAFEHPVRFHHDPEACANHAGQARGTYVANRLAHRYGFGCAADSADLFEDAICTKAGLNETWLGDLDRRAPGLFQVARQIVA